MDELFKYQDLALILLGSLLEEYKLLDTTLLNRKGHVSLSEVEAVTYVCHLVNLLPSTAIYAKSQFEKWYGKPDSDYDSLYIFDFAAYYHVKESRLDLRAKKALFMGRTFGIKGNRLWCLEIKKTILAEMLPLMNIPYDRETFDDSPMVDRDNEEDEVQTEEPPQQHHESISTSNPKRNNKRRAHLNDTVASASSITADDVHTTYLEAV
nr:retrovirus-related Pol polyprotein from transposon TNT 1-94 [Tanacetum cinerariifolium]